MAVAKSDGDTRIIRNDNPQNERVKFKIFVSTRDAILRRSKKPFLDFEEDSTNFLILFPGKSTKINCFKGL